MKYFSRFSSQVRINWKRLIHYEFWPYWLFYFPAYFYYFYLALKSRRLVYFSVLNPCMNFGGAFLSSKHSYLNEVAQKWKPKSIRVSNTIDLEFLKNKIVRESLKFPLILKPDMGERGRNVEKIENYNELEFYFKEINQLVLIQEYIDYPIELGILFFWDTDRKPQITSIGKKEFCVVKGNGSDTLETLISNNHRIAHRKKILKKRFKKQWQQIIPLNKKILVEPIGNHNKGTIFYDARNHYSEEMLEWVSDCVKNIKGFDYGRIDLKMEHWNSFKNKKGIKILEINGVNSEPIHIYDPRYSIWKAYKAIFHHMHIIYRLSKHKLNQSHQTCSLFEFIRGGQAVLNKNKLKFPIYEFRTSEKSTFKPQRFN